MNALSQVRAGMILGALVASLALVACGDDDSSGGDGGGGSATAASSGSAKLSEPTKMRMLTVPYFAIERIAAAKGFFDKYNLDVEFVDQTAQGLGGVQAVLAGQVDTGQSFGVFTPIEIDARGGAVKDVVASANSSDGDYRFYVQGNSGIDSCKDLEGKTVGVVNTGSYADVALAAYLRGCDLELDSVERIAVPLNTMCSALTGGQIDAAGMYSLFYIPCEKEKGDAIKLLFEDNEVLPSAKLYAAFLFTNKFIEEKPDVVRAFVAAIKGATDFLLENPAEGKRIIAEATKIKPSLLRVPTYPKGNCIDPGAAEEWTAQLEELGHIEAGSVEATDWYTNEFNPDCPS